MSVVDLKTGRCVSFQEEVALRKPSGLEAICSLIEATFAMAVYHVSAVTSFVST